MTLCDSDIFIELFKGNSRTYNIIKTLGIPIICVSAITVVELYHGAFNSLELNTF